MTEKQIFETTLEKHGASEATGIKIPFDVEKVFGAKRVPVKVEINGAKYRSTIFKMRGSYFVAIPKIFRDAAGINAGDSIRVSLEKDAEKRSVEIPEDLAEALKKANLADAFAKMSFTHQKEYVRSVEDAKKEETKIRRIEKCVAMLSEMKK